MSSSRRGSVVPGLKKGGADLSKRRQSNATTSLSSQKSDVQPIKESDIYYKTQRIFPSIEHDEDISWTVVKAFDPHSPLPVPTRNKSGDRRASTHPTIREETPVFDEQISARDRYGTN